MRIQKLFFTSIIPLFCLLMVITVSQAQTLFIKPTSEVPLRRGQGVDYKILAILADGTPVQLIEQNESWTKISTKDGREGWVLKRYLTEEKPLTEAMEALREKNQTLTKQLETIKERTDSLAEEKELLQKALGQKISEIGLLSEKYNTLLKDASDTIDLQAQVKRDKQLLLTLQQQLSTTTAAKEKLEQNENLKWYLAGGTTLLIGIFIGFLSRGSKKKKSSLY